VFLFRLILQMVHVHFMLHPDENWQSLEVAYDLVYGKRGSLKNQVDINLSWEFNNNYSLRNHLYPLWLSIPSFMLKSIGWDTNFLVVNSMYTMHCVLLALGDYYFFHLVQVLAGKRCAVLAVMCSLCHDDLFRFVSRVSSNGVEGTLVSAAFYHFIQIKPHVLDPSINKMVLWITLAFITRSSSLVPWLPLALLKMWEDFNFFIPFVVSGVLVTLPLCALSVAIDSFFYGVFTIP
jgi:hypothetical protein